MSPAAAISIIFLAMAATSSGVTVLMRADRSWSIRLARGFPLSTQAGRTANAPSCRLGRRLIACFTNHLTQYA